MTRVHVLISSESLFSKGEIYLSSMYTTSIYYLCIPRAATDIGLHEQSLVRISCMWTNDMSYRMTASSECMDALCMHGDLNVAERGSYWWHNYESWILAAIFITDLGSTGRYYYSTVCMYWICNVYLNCMYKIAL